MFVRKKKNKSGAISVQIIDKSSGTYKVIKTIGSSSIVSEVDNLIELQKEIRKIDTLKTKKIVRL